MHRGISSCLPLLLAVMLPLRAVAADSPIVPIVQLTAQPARFLDHDNCVGALLLRELQRQAVLIAARDELGLGTRDMVLREPFLTDGSDGVSTVLFESRIWRDDQAQICLSRLSGAQPPNLDSLADMQVDRPQNSCVQWVSFKITKGAIPDYADFVTRCEQASRGSYLKALLAENVLGPAQPNPIPWVPPNTPAPADPAALQRLGQFDVFSQYLAVRLLHQQIRARGASPQRMSALVRGYANLGALTHDQWSRANKVFLARALLYSQRLAVHENFSAASLYSRAYARAFTGLHAAALNDLDSAADAGQPPPLAVLVRAMCSYDPYPLQAAVALAPWQDRQLATFLTATVLSDRFPDGAFQDAVHQAIAKYPGMFVLDPLCEDGGAAENPTPLDQMVNQMPVVVSEVLKTAELPASVNYAARRLSEGEESFKSLAMLRDRLNDATSKTPWRSIEPSLGVLADLIEQQEMLAIVHLALDSKNTGAGTADLQKLASNAMAILKVHPWGPYIDALGLEPNGEDGRLTSILAKIRDRDSGPWADDALNRLDGLSASDNHAKSLRDTAALTADALVYDYSYGGDEAYLRRLCKSSPHSGTLIEAWLRSVPINRILSQNQFYDSTIKRVEEEFSNRPAVVLAACEWCNARGDFQRSLAMLEKIDQVEPSVDVCNSLACLEWRLGRHDDSIAQLLRIPKLSGDPNEITTAYQQAAVDLIEDHRYEEALARVQQSADSPTSRTWQLMARCYEAMGQLDDADQCLRQQAISDPPSVAQHYLWAKRLGRRDLKEIHRKAQQVFAQQTEFMPEFYLRMADDQEPKALDILRRYRGSMDDAFPLAQLAILAKKQNDNQTLADAMSGLSAVGPEASFGPAFKALAQTNDVSQATAAFDLWISRQLYDESAVDWYSLAGRYLVAAGHPAEGKSYLIRGLHQPAHEQEDYFLTWRELLKMGEDPRKLLGSAAIQQ